VLRVSVPHVITALLVIEHAHRVLHFTLPLVLGTLGGHLLLTDLAHHVPHAHMQVHHVTAAEYDGTVPLNSLPLLVINHSAHTADHMQYPVARDEVTLLPHASVSVTALVESAHGVIVGYNFGCVQLWSLTTFTCQLTSELYGT